MMGEGDALGLKVKITPIIDRSKLNNEARKVENQLNRNMKLSGTGGAFMKNFQNLMPKSMRSMIGSLNRSTGAGGAGAGGMKNAAVAGAVGGLMASAMQGVMSVLHKMFNVLNESSGALRGVMKLLNMGFMQILRPIGDVLAMLLRPIAMFFRIIGREIMKRMRAKRQELKDRGYSGIALAGALMAEMPAIYLDVIFEQLSKVDWSDLFGKIATVMWENITQRLPAFAEKVMEKLGQFAGWLWKEITGAIGSLALTALATFAEWMWKQIVGAIGTAATWVGSMFEGAATLGVWLWKQMVGAIGTASSWISSMFDGMGDFGSWLWKEAKKVFGITDTGVLSQGKASAVASGQNGAMWDIAGAGKDALNLLTGGMFSKITGLAEGGLMTSDGLVYAHAGEAVIGTENLRGMIREEVGNAVINNTFVLPAGALANAIDSRVDFYYRNKVVSRR